MTKNIKIIITVIVAIILTVIICKYSTYDESTKNCQYDKDANRLQQQIEGAKTNELNPFGWTKN